MADKELIVRVRHAYATAAQWTSANPVLMSGEMGIESDTRKHKIGDGVTAWNSLSYPDSAGVEIDSTLSSTSTNPVQNKVISAALDNKQAKGNYVTYTANSNITAGKFTGTTYCYGQSPMVVKNGLIIGGTAANAGLVTRGICGVSNPNTNTGACKLDALFINYDGNNTYARAMVLGADGTGGAITLSTAATTEASNKYGASRAAIRGDQMVNYVTDKLANYKVTVDSELSASSTNPVQNKVISAALEDKANTSDILVTVGDYTAITGKENLVVINPDGEDCYISEVDIVKSYADKAAESASSAKTYNDNITATINTVTTKVDGAVSAAESAQEIAQSALEKVDTQALVDMFYPVGSVYMTTSDTLPAFMSYGTWEEIANDRVLQGASSAHSAGSTVEAGLPNITGSTAWACNGLVIAFSRQKTAYSSNNGALSVSQDGNAYGMIGTSGSDSATSNVAVSLDASKSDSIYGASATVQPPAYIVHIYKRTA